MDAEFQHSESPTGWPSEAFDVILASARQQQYTAVNQITSISAARLNWVRNGSQAIDALCQRSAPVLLADKRLPDMECMELLAETEALSEPPTMIVLSDEPDIALWQSVLNNGGFDVLTPPFQRDALLQTLSAAYKRWQRRIEIRTARKPNTHSGRNGVMEHFRVA
jgi:two-component system C4-dicarboxylate transport response regulator DctD